MYVCMCKGLTDGDIRRGVLTGEVACMDSLREQLGAATGCGSCAVAASECLTKALADKQRVEAAHADDLIRNPRQGEAWVSPMPCLAAPQLSYG